MSDFKLTSGCVNEEGGLSIMYFLPNQGRGEWEGGLLWCKENTSGAVRRDCQLKVGQVDYDRFQQDDPPPFYDLNTQRFDRPMTITEKTLERAKCEKRKERELND